MSRLQRGRRTMFQKIILILFCFTLLLSPFGSAFGGSMGQVHAEGSDSAMEITDVEGLNDMRSDLGGSYILGADLDLSEVADWELIGDTNIPFTGEFNGSGFKITGMGAAFEGTDYEGLFGAVSDDAIVEGLVVEFKAEVVPEAIKSEEESAEVELEDPVSQSIEESAEVELEDPVSQPTKIKTMTGDEGEEDQLGFSGAGSGSAEDPYLISNADQLDEVRHHLDKHFKQMIDIDLDGIDWRPIGKNTIDSEAFNGIYDGNGKKIKNLNVEHINNNQNLENDGLGLFGALNGGKLKNIILENISVVGENSELVGGLVGRSYEGEISNISMSGTVKGYENVGGIIGLNNNGEIRNSSTSGTVIGGQQVGGLLGYNYSDNYYNYKDSYGVFDSFSSAKVFGSSGAGGLVGYNGVNVRNSYATGKVEGKIVKRYAEDYGDDVLPSTMGGASRLW